MFDDMRPKERKKAFHAGRDIDRLPTWCFLLKKLIRDSAYIHLLVGKLTDLTVEAISAIKGLDVLTWLGDPIASGSMLGTEQYRIFAKPYQRRVIEAVRAAVPQNDHMLHMCGNTARLWEEMADTGAKLINIDDSIDFADASRRIGDRVHLVGNIAPMTMLIGKADDIEKDVKRSIRDSARAKTLPIPGFGDAPPLSAPIENFDILYAALRKYAKWPLDFEVLQA